MHRKLPGRYAIAVISFAVAGLLSGCASANGPVSDSPMSTGTPSPSSTPISLVDQAWESVQSRYPDAERPETELVRYVSAVEMAGVQAQCLNEEGFPEATTTPDGGLLVQGVPAAQQEILAIAGYVCAIKYQVDGQYTDAFTNEELTLLYDYYSTMLVPCLEGQGVTVSSVPSLGTYVDSYKTTGWNPYIDVEPASDEVWYELNEACPPWPAGFWG